VLNDVFENDFYRIRLGDGGLSSVFDKELGMEIIDITKFKAGEVFTMQSVGHGAGEFDNVQQPGMEGFDKTGNYTTQWELVANGPVYTAFKIRQPIRNAVVEEVVTIYNTIKKIDLEVSLLKWEGVLFREYRMAMPLNMH
jgi:alpha-mannosidase